MAIYEVIQEDTSKSSKTRSKNIWGGGSPYFLCHPNNILFLCASSVKYIEESENVLDFQASFLQDESQEVQVQSKGYRFFSKKVQVSTISKAIVFF